MRACAFILLPGSLTEWRWRTTRSMGTLIPRAPYSPFFTLACTGASAIGKMLRRLGPTALWDRMERKKKREFTIPLAGGRGFVLGIISQWLRWRSVYRNSFIASIYASPKFNPE